uniref:Neurotransmitter-gated ion-channel ligand-binding domain-containing protein n=1 Tax=Acrobeloides nanus TaxID=290746 RepID=A0A914CVZ2_9BILA
MLRVATNTAQAIVRKYDGPTSYRTKSSYDLYCSEEEERLVIELFKGYNSLVRPVPNISSMPVEVSFSLAMVLLINVDEKNQIMQTNVWPTMRWYDYQMKWDPRLYGHIKTIRVPPDRVWLPDIVLFNKYAHFP